jgi:hypothetical protein
MDTNLSETPKTESGLVVKHTGRVEDIHSRMEVRVTPVIITWQICRLMRRDFNYTTTKMFLKCLRKSTRSQVNDLLAEVVIQAEFLKSYADQFDLSFDLGGEPIPIRLICPEASMLYKTLLTVDNSIARLDCAQADLKITYQNSLDAIGPVFSAVSDLKSYCCNPKNKTASVLAVENGIS